MNIRDPLAAGAASIPDVQASADTRRLAIDKVGIKSIRHPIQVAVKGGGVQHTIATFNMYVGLPHHFKGTHMSRFVEILNAHEREISVDSFKLMLREMTERLEADSGHIEMNFPYFVNKAAPVSGVQSLMDYDVTFFGGIEQRPAHLHHEGRRPGDQPLPVLEGDLRLRRAQPALARHDHRAHPRLRLDRGPRLVRRKPGVLGAVRPAQAPGRETRHGTRL